MSCFVGRLKDQYSIISRNSNTLSLTKSGAQFLYTVSLTALNAEGRRHKKLENG
jgi:hypothetical protein